MNSTKKEQERRLLDHFLAAWSDGTVIASIDDEEREAPDFAGVLTNGCRLGIELVRLVDPSLAKSHSDIHDRFVPELQEACRVRAKAATIHLSFAEWDASRLREREHRRKLAAAIADFVREARDHRQAIYRTSLEARGIDGIDVLSFYAEQGNDVGVLVGRNTWGRGPNEIQAAIASKDALTSDYHRNLGQDAALWLLVAAGICFASSVPPPMKQLTFDTAFDRVFFLDCWPIRAGRSVAGVVELPIRPLG